MPPCCCNFTDTLQITVVLTSTDIVPHPITATSLELVKALSDVSYVCVKFQGVDVMADDSNSVLEIQIQRKAAQIYFHTLSMHV